MQEQIAGVVPLVAVGFSPPDALGRLADHLGLTGRMLSDQDRALYRLLGLGRAPIRQVYSPGTLLHYARALAHGRRLRKPVEDIRQLGGDALVVDGAIRRVWRPASPDDRVDPAVIGAAARSG